MMDLGIGLVSVLDCSCRAPLACHASRSVRVDEWHFNVYRLHCRSPFHPDSGNESCPWQPKKTRAQKMHMRDD